MKNQLIDEIKSSLNYVFEETYCNSITYGEMETDSPVISSIGNIVNISELVEELFQHKVGVWTYQNELVVNEQFLTYEELDNDNLKKINEDLRNFILSM